MSAASTHGGRSIVFGYGSKRVIRFYDKVGELAARGEESDHVLDTILRYEIQERRRREAALAVGDWQPVIPPDAFEASSDPWRSLDEAA